MTFARYDSAPHSVPKSDANGKIAADWLPSTLETLSVSGSLRLPVVSSLPASGSAGEVCQLSSDQMVYVWDSSTSSWRALGGSSSSSPDEIELADGTQSVPSLRFISEPHMGLYVRPQDTTTEITGAYWNYKHESNAVCFALKSGPHTQDVLRISARRDRRSSDNELWYCGQIQIGEPELGAGLELGAKPRTTSSEIYGTYITFLRLNTSTSVVEPGFVMYQGSGGGSISMQVRCLDVAYHQPGDYDYPLQFQYHTNGFCRIAYSGKRAISIGTPAATPGTITLGGIAQPTSTPSINTVVAGDGFLWVGRALRVETQQGFVEIGHRNSGNYVSLLKADPWNNAQIRFATNSPGNQRGAIEVGSDDQLALVGGWNSGDYIRVRVGSGLPDVLKISSDALVVGETTPAAIVLKPRNDLPASPANGTIVNHNGTLKFFDGSSWKTITMI